MPERKMKTTKQVDNILVREISKHDTMKNSNYTIPERKMKTTKKVDKIPVHEISRHHAIRDSYLHYACKKKGKP